MGSALNNRSFTKKVGTDIGVRSAGGRPAAGSDHTWGNISPCKVVNTLSTV